MLPAEALIFDMDGLLLDTETLYVKAFQKVVAPFGHVVVLETYADWVGRQVTYDDFQALYPCPLTEEEAFSQMRTEFARLVEEELALMPGVLDFLDGAGARYPKAIASSTRKPTIEQHLRQAGLLDRFQVIVSGRDVPRGKPAPDVYLAAAEQLGVAPERCVVFEDSHHGIAGGHAAGMRTVAIPTELTAMRDFSLADLIVKRLDEVTAVWLNGAA